MFKKNWPLGVKSQLVSPMNMHGKSIGKLPCSFLFDEPLHGNRIFSFVLVHALLPSANLVADMQFIASKPAT